MIKYLKWASLVLFAAASVILKWPQIVLDSNITVRSGELTLSGLQSIVTVRYDAYAVPTIDAENEHDLFFAAGYVMASERMFQMDMVNRAAQGRLSEMNASLVGSDRYLRTWGFHRIGKQLVDAMDPATLQILQWSCDGINVYIDSHLDDLPVEFQISGHQPLIWTPAVVAAYSRLMAHEFKSSYNAEVVQSLVMDKFGPAMANDLLVGGGGSAMANRSEPLEALRNFLTMGQDALEPIAGAPGLGGSNSWVLSGSRTKSGKSILANDPHIGYTQPAKWLEMHLRGGRFDVRGVFLAGIPIAVLGNNRDIAWGMTVVTVDDADFFVETVNVDNPAEYLYKGEWLPFDTRDETFAVRDGDSVTVTIRETVHGVIINDLHPLLNSSGSPVAMRWTGQDIVDLPTGMLNLNLATDWDSFSDALRNFNVPGQNFVFADRDGNIGWRPAAQVPIRKDADKLLLRPGASGEWDWLGYIPFEEMPFLYNPPEGYIATANHKTVDDDYPYYISRYWSGPYRINRIREMIGTRNDHTLASMAAIQIDGHSDFARQLTPMLLASVDAAKMLNKKTAQAIDLLRHWDYAMDADLGAPALFGAWVMALVDAIYTDQMADIGDGAMRAYLDSPNIVRQNMLRIIVRGESGWFDDSRTPEVESRDDILRQSFVTANDNLSDRLGGGPSSWRWGEMHTLTHVHALSRDPEYGTFLNWWLELDVGPFEYSGSPTTTNAQAYKFYNPYDITNGPSYRGLFDLGDWDRGQIAIPTGQSGNPLDEHYRDQADLYNAGKYRSVAFSEEAVAKSTVSTLVLKP